MFAAALFTITKSWKQPVCLLADKCIKKLWHIYTMQYYSAIKNNETAICSNMLDLKIILLNEVRQRKTNIKWYLFYTSLIAQLVKNPPAMQETSV